MMREDQYRFVVALLNGEEFEGTEVSSLTDIGVDASSPDEIDEFLGSFGGIIAKDDSFVTLHTEDDFMVFASRSISHVLLRKV